MLLPLSVYGVVLGLVALLALFAREAMRGFKLRGLTIIVQARDTSFRNKMKLELRARGAATHNSGSMADVGVYTMEFEAERNDVRVVLTCPRTEVSEERLFSGAYLAPARFFADQLERRSDGTLRFKPPAPVVVVASG